MGLNHKDIGSDRYAPWILSGWCEPGIILKNDFRPDRGAWLFQKKMKFCPDWLLAFLESHEQACEPFLETGNRWHILPFLVFVLSPIIALALANSCLIYPVKTSTLVSALLHRSLESSLSLLQLHITADACRYAPVYASSERSAEEWSRSLMWRI